MSDIENSNERNLNNSNKNLNEEDEVEKSVHRKEDIGINTSALDPEELKRLVENNPELLEEIKENSVLSAKYDKNEVDADLEKKNIERKKAELMRKEEEDKLIIQKRKRQEKIKELDEKE